MDMIVEKINLFCTIRCLNSKILNLKLIAILLIKFQYN